MLNSNQTHKREESKSSRVMKNQKTSNTQCVVSPKKQHRQEKTMILIEDNQPSKPQIQHRTLNQKNNIFEVNGEVQMLNSKFKNSVETSLDQ